MQQRIAVGVSFTAWWWLVLVALSVGIAATAVLAEGVNWSVPTMLLFGASLVAVGVGAAVIALRRRWVTVTPGGFALHDRTGTRGFTDENVVCVSLLRKNNYFNGVLKSVTRTFCVWADDGEGTEMVRMVNKIAVGKDDPLGPMIERIHQRLKAQAQRQIEAGQPYDGEGWTLEPDELVVAQGRDHRVLPLAELSGAGVYDGAVCLWRRGEDDPVARIPLVSANSLVLLDLLQERIPPSDEPPAGKQLGRVLFERKPGAATTIILWLFGAFAAIVTVPFLFLVVGAIAGLGKIEPSLALTAGLIVLGAWLVWLLVYAFRVTLRCHEYGVCRKTPFREDRLRYADVATFTYSAVRQFVNGIYSGTSLSMTFIPQSPEAGRKIRYSTSLRKGDEELDNLRNHISQVIAARMLEDLRQGRPVQWLPHVRLLPDGIEFRAVGFIGRKEAQVIALGEVAGLDIQEGVFHIWVQGKKKSVIHEAVSQPNFFPGFFALSALFHPPDESIEAEIVEDATEA